MTIDATIYFLQNFIEVHCTRDMQRAVLGVLSTRMSNGIKALAGIDKDSEANTEPAYTDMSGR